MSLLWMAETIGQMRRGEGGGVVRYERLGMEDRPEGAVPGFGQVAVEVYRRCADGGLFVRVIGENGCDERLFEVQYDGTVGDTWLRLVECVEE